MSTDSVISRFKKYLTKQDLSKRTIEGYLDDIRFFCVWFEEIQHTPIDLLKITEFELQSYRQYLVNGRRQKVSAVNRRIQGLKRLFNWAHSQGMISRENPAEHLRFMRKQPPTQPASLMKNEVHSLLRAAGQSSHGLSKRNYAMVQLMLQAGLRISEVINLRHGDIKLQAKSGTVSIIDSKGMKSREVPLNLTVRNALKNYFSLCVDREENSPIFLSKRKKNISLRSVQAMINRLVKRAKLTRIEVSAHTLRHTFATNYLRANPNQLVELAQLLGHDSLNTTAIYTKSSQVELAEAIEKSEINVYGDT